MWASVARAAASERPTLRQTTGFAASARTLECRCEGGRAAERSRGRARSPASPRPRRGNATRSAASRLISPPRRRRAKTDPRPAGEINASPIEPDWTTADDMARQERVRHGADPGRRAVGPARFPCSSGRSTAAPASSSSAATRATIAGPSAPASAPIPGRRRSAPRLPSASSTAPSTRVCETRRRASSGVCSGRGDRREARPSCDLVAVRVDEQDVGIAPASAPSIGRRLRSDAPTIATERGNRAAERRRAALVGVDSRSSEASSSRIGASAMHEKRIEIRWRDMDAFRHVNNAVYLTYLEEVAGRVARVACSATRSASGTSSSRASRSTSAASSRQDDDVVRRAAAGSTASAPRASAPARRSRAGRDDCGRGRGRARRPRPRRGRLAAADARGARRRSSASCDGLACPPVPHLLSPLGLGRSSFATASSRPSHQTNLVHDHLPTDEFVAYHEARARGGVGLIVLEATAVHESGLLHRAHAGRLPGRRSSTATGGSRRRCSGTARGSSSSSSTEVASRSRPRRGPRRSRPPRSRASASRPSRERCATRRSTSSSTATPVRPSSPPTAAWTGSRSRPRTTTSSRSSSRRRSTQRTTAGGSARRSCSRSSTPCARRRPGSRSAFASRPTRSPRRRVAHELAGRVDYLSLALGESSTYRGSTGIVPPPPLPENAIATSTESFRVGPPIIATSRDRRPGRGRPR